MDYTVKKVCNITGVTIKTLHHYHKIGLLSPKEITDAGYRIYSDNEIIILQQILFYRSLGLSLNLIKDILNGTQNRLVSLMEQAVYLKSRLADTQTMIDSLEDTIMAIKGGKELNTDKMFTGFGNKQQWHKALEEQDSYLSQEYGYSLKENADNIAVEKLNADAAEATSFINSMASFLSDGKSADSPETLSLIQKHINYLNKGTQETTADDFVRQSSFFTKDDFHRNLLENQQTGLSYYILCAAMAYKEKYMLE